jgi:hypothetical protein
VRLARVGSDNAIGYLTVDRDGVFPAELRDMVQTAPWISVAASLMRAQGFDNVSDLAGGYIAWVEASCDIA